MNEVQEAMLSEKREVMKKLLQYMLDCDPGNAEYEKVHKMYQDMANSIDKSVEFNETLYEKQCSTLSNENLEREKFEFEKLEAERKYQLEMAKFERDVKNAKGQFWKSVAGSVLGLGVGAAMHYTEVNSMVNGVTRNKTLQDASRNTRNILDVSFKQL